MARTDGDRARGARASARADRDQHASIPWAGRDIWIVLAGAIVMAFAGGLVGAAVGMDELAYPTLSGPRLRISPLAEVTSASLSRETPSGDAEA